MLRRRTVAIVGLVGCLLLASRLQAQEHREDSAAPATDAEREITAVLEEVFAATERADYTALDTLYTGEDLTIIEGASIDRTWAEYRDHHLKPELELFKDLLYRPHHIEPHVIGEVGWAIFQYDLEVQLEDRKIERVGHGTAIFERRNDRWVIRHVQTATRPREETRQ